jgi:hypothetical protein
VITPFGWIYVVGAIAIGGAAVVVGLALVLGAVPVSILKATKFIFCAPGY